MRSNKTQRFTSLVDFRRRGSDAALSDAREFGLRIVSCRHLKISECRSKKGPFLKFRRIWQDFLFGETGDFYLYEISTRSRAKVLRLDFYNVIEGTTGTVDIRAQEDLNICFRSGCYDDCYALAYVEVNETGRFEIIKPA